MPEVPQPFRFYTRVHLRELTGVKAKNLRELLFHIKTVPGSVIYHHTHHFLQQHQYLSPEPPNDFAYWVTEALHETQLGEKLASINTCEFSTIRTLRDKIAAAIESFLERCKNNLKESEEGQEFHFIRSVSFVFPTPYSVSTLEDFCEVLGKVSIHSIYYHMFEARLRLEKGVNDFSLWLETALREEDLARKIARLDPYTHTLEALREKMMGLVTTRLQKTAAPLGREKKIT